MFGTLVLLACNQPSAICTIQGVTNKYHDGDTVMLFRFRRDTISLDEYGNRTRSTSDTIFWVDTTIVIDGQFEFRSKEDLEDLAVVTMGNWPDSVFSIELALERGVIQVNLDSMTFCGTPLNDAYNANKNYIVQNSKEKGDMWASMERVRYVERNIRNPFGRSEFYSFRSFSADYNAFMNIFEKMDEKYRKLPEVQETMEGLKELKRMEEFRYRLQGKPITDFELIVPDGSIAHISDFIGRSDFLLIDFWASWCEPCIKDIPFIRGYYESTDRKTFDVLSISLDENVELWKNAILKQGVVWNNLCVKDNGEQLRAAYGFYGIPYAVLIDRKGICVYAGLNCQVLEQIVSRLQRTIKKSVFCR